MTDKERKARHWEKTSRDSTERGNQCDVVAAAIRLSVLGQVFLMYLFNFPTFADDRKAITYV